MYTEAQKAIAVEIVDRFNGEVSAVALAEVRVALQVSNLPKATVWRWLQSRETGKKALTPEAKAKAAQALDRVFEETARAYLTHALKEEVIAKTSGQAAVIAAATAVDKMRLLRNMPTEIVEIMPMLLLQIEANGLNARLVFQAMLDQLQEARSASLG